MRKYLLVVLPFFLLTSLFLLTACSSNINNTTASQTVPYTNANSNSDNGGSNTNSTYTSKTLDNDPSMLGDFVDGLNNHEVSTLLDLFNDDSTLTQVNQFMLGTPFSLDMEYQNSRGKAEIKNWLEYEGDAITGVMPQNYQVSANSVTLFALFYYPDWVEDVRIEAQTQQGKFYSLYFYIEKITYS